MSGLKLSIAVAERAGTFDPLAVYREQCSAGGKPDTALFETGAVRSHRAERSIVMTQAALRLEGRGRDVRAIPLDEVGAAALLLWRQALLKQPAVQVESFGDMEVAHWPAEDRPLEERERLRLPGPLDAVRALRDAFAPVGRPRDLILPGLLAYDLVDQFEVLPEGKGDRFETPDFIFWLPSCLLELNHVEGKSRAVVIGPQSKAASRLAEVTESLATATAERPGVEKIPGTGLPADVVEVDLEDEAYGAVVLAVQQQIALGNVYQAVPSRTFSTACPDPLAAYGMLRISNPSPWLFYLHLGEEVLFGASPETCLRVERPTDCASLFPLAGTRPRGRRADGSIDPELDLRQEVELRLSAKETAEHMMLVDLARNDLARICRPGERQVTRLLEVERYSRVMHLGSCVEGKLQADIDSLQAYTATLNMGTLVGAPKIEAAALLRRLERDRRGWYGGAVGFLGGDDSLETAIVIRSATVRGGVARVRAGAGIVEDSIPQAEADETRRKAQAVLESILSAREASHA